MYSLDISGAMRSPLTPFKEEELPPNLSVNMVENLLNACPDCLYIYDVRKRQLIYRNKALHKILGFGSHEIECPGALIPRELQHPDDQVNTDQLMQTLQALAPGNVRVFEFRMRTRDQRWHHFHTRITPLGDDGRLVLGMISDINAEKLAEQLSLNALISAKEASKAKSEFLTRMSHEIRTPLNAMAGAANLLLATSLSPEQTEYAEILQRSSAALIAVVNGIVDLAKIESGEIEINERAFNPVKILEQAIFENTERARTKNTELVMNMEGAIPETLIGDPDRVKYVLQNLVSNAVDVTESGVVSVEVRGAHAEGACRIRFSVRDSGGAIHPKFRKHLFKKNRSSATDQVHAGHDLSICKQIVDRMGGRIGYYDLGGSGSAFWFELDLLEEEGTTLWDENLRADFTNKKVLILSDRPASGRSLQNQFENWHAAVQRFNLIPDAEEAALSENFDWVFLDVHHQNIAAGQTAKFFLDGLKGVDPRKVVLVVPTDSYFGSAQKLVEHGRAAICVTQPLSFLQLKHHFDLQRETTTGTFRLNPQTQDNQKPLVLVVDDNPENRAIAAQMVTKAGAYYMLAHSASDALIAANCYPPDLIIMNCQMSGLNFAEVTRQFKDNRVTKNIPILGLSDHLSSTEREIYEKAGMNDVLVQPLMLSQIRSSIHIWAA